MIQTALLVGLGGALGSVLRYVAQATLPFPFGTLGINILGSFLIGLVWVLLAPRGAAILFLMVGVLGGFTTFSTFSMDTLRMVEDGRLGAAGGYALASVALSLMACAAGLWLGRSVLA